MQSPFSSPAPAMNRRAALQRLGLNLGALLALGAWPGTLRADNETPTRRFRFVVVNDTHHMSAECGTYLTGAVQRMKQASPQFCLHCGDLTEKGQPENLEAVHQIFQRLELPLYPVIGNHDYVTQTDNTAYVKRFPLRLNYYFRHEGWQFIGLDTSEGLKYEKTSVQPATLQWLDEYLPRLAPRQPTVVFTHFPLGAGVNYRPFNAEDVLYRFRDFNLQAVFCGHFHGRTERVSGQAILTTNSCCALKRNNHDGTKPKGFFVCDAVDGKLTREFVEYIPGGA
jgi:3',5'-cyclic AMP phosphodiesterase CpdA